MSSVDTSVYPSAFDPEKFFLPASNNTKTTLATYVAPNQLNNINVVSTNGFPDEGVISIDNEVIYYRSKTTSSFRNITRGYDGTISFQHATGSSVELRWVAAHHNRLKNAVKAVQRTLGINPQGSFPDVASRLNAAFSSANRRTSIIFNKNDGLTASETGYSDGPHLARMFLSPERFINVSKFHPVVFVDGLAQHQNDPFILVDNAQISSLDVNDGTNKGIITCSTASFLGSGIQVGDLVVVKGTPTNNDAYIIDSVLSNTQLKVTEIIFGVDQLVGAIGTITVISVTSITSPVKDVVCVPVGFASSDEADAVIFLDPPTTDQVVRVNYDVKNASAAVIYSTPIAIVADYNAPTNSSSITANGNSIFTLNIGRSRALAFKVRLSSTTSPQPTNVKIEIYGKNDLTERQYLAEYVDLSTGEFIDNGVWHFENKDLVETSHAYVKITDLSNQAFDYTFIFEVEALGNNV